MSETTTPTGGSNKELHVEKTNSTLEENMKKAGYDNLVVNIMEARIKDEKMMEAENTGANSSGNDSSSASTNNDKKKKVTLIIGGLPYAKVPMAKYIELLNPNRENADSKEENPNFQVRPLKERAQEKETQADKLPNKVDRGR